MTRALLENTQVSDEILQLVRTVERLGTADQERILRIVRLLAVVPGRIQMNTKAMLRRLVDGNPNAIYDNVDQLIEYLEDSILDELDLGSEHDTYIYPAMSRLRN